MIKSNKVLTIKRIIMILLINLNIKYVIKVLSKLQSNANISNDNLSSVLKK